MNSFGLGLVLNFVDNASSGMRNATNTFQAMSRTADALASSVTGSITDMVSASYALDSVGSLLQGVGTSIVNVYSNVSDQIINSGKEMMGFRARLSALYGDFSEQKLEEIKEYARTSVFEVRGLIAAVAMMKTVGIEAMQQVTSATGKTSQRLLDYASDLAGMVPNMRNMYGTGVEAAMGAIKEYVAEGNALSLKRGAGLDITGILGEKKGSTMDERLKQVANLIEKLGIAGYTKNLENTPTQHLAKLSDTLYNLKADIADSGVFERYSNLLKSLSDWVETLVKDTELYNTVVKISSEVVSELLIPLQSIVDYFVANTEAIVNWIKENPKLIKNIALTTVAVGGILIALGSFLKLLSSVAMASIGLNFLKELPTILSTVGGAFTTLITKATPFLALAGLLYYAWEENLFGIKDTTLGVIQDLGSIFSILGDAFSDNTLSEDKFKKAEQMGILPFIESILQLKYYWGYFIEGFKEGFKSFFDGLKEYLSTFESFGIDIGGLFGNLGEFLKSLLDVGAEDRWRTVGENLGKIAGALVVIAVAVNSLKAVISIVSGVATVIGGIVSVFGFITKIPFAPVIAFVVTLKGVFLDLFAAISLIRGGFGVFEVLSAWFPKTASVIKIVSGIATGLAGALGISVGWLAVIVAGVVALGVIIYKNWDAIKSFVSQIPEWILSNVLIPIRNFFATVLNFIVGLVATIWEAISAFISPIAQWVYDNIITPVVDFFVGLWEGICVIASDIFNSVCEFLSPIAQWVSDNIITPVTDFFSSLWESISKIASDIYDALVGAFQDAFDFVTNLWDGIKDFFGGIWEKVSGWASDITKKGEDITGIQSKISVPQASSGVENFVGGLIQVNESGGELINLPSGSTVIPHDESLEDSFNMGANSLASLMSKGEQPKVVSKVENDYSVTFSAGSVVVQVMNATEAELEKAAEKLMRIIERKQQLNAMAMR